MKKIKLVLPSFCIFLSIFGLSLTSKPEAVFAKLAAGKTIYLNDSTNEEIKSYYSSLSSLNSSELQGDNLLKNLRKIIQLNNTTYFLTFDDVGGAVRIVDRDWVNSPKEEFSDSTLGKYDATTNTITNYTIGNDYKYDDQYGNPALRKLYHDPSTGVTKYYKISGSTYSRDYDKEHVWSQSHGFSLDENKNLLGAGTDLHHLMAGDSTINRNFHSNYTYGFTKQPSDTSKDYRVYMDNIVSDEGLFTHPEDVTNPSDSRSLKVFEPRDSDKGDIARALFYMAAAYNNIGIESSYTWKVSDSISKPVLKLVNYKIDAYGANNGLATSESTKEAGYYGMLQDLLAWHKMDPVDEYEIHRNNLIYNNYQPNRNPFIDFPQWVDYIWGTATYDTVEKTIDYQPTPTGSVNLSKDVINGYYEETISVADQLTITRSSFSSASKYSVPEDWEATSTNGNLIKGSADISATSSYMQMSSSSLYGPYNNDPLPGRITNITLVPNSTQTSSTKRTLPLYVSSTPLTSPTGSPVHTFDIVKGGQITSYVPNEDDDFRYFYFASPSAAIYLDSITITFETNNGNSAQAYEWSESFNQKLETVCSLDGNTNTNVLLTTWSEVKTTFTSLSSSVQSIIKNSALADANHQSTIDKAIEKYQYIVQKYINILDDFIYEGSAFNLSRDVDAVKNHNKNIYLIILFTTVSIIPLGLLLYKRKGKSY